MTRLSRRGIFAGSGRLITPPDVTSATLEAWWDAEQETAYSDADPVGTVTDQSGNGIDLTSLTTARPLWRQTGMNGVATYDFDGTNDFARNTTLPDMTQPLSLACLLNHHGAGSIDVFASGNQQNNNADFRINSSDQFGLAWSTQRMITTAHAAGVHAVVYVVDAASSQVWVDGVDYSSELIGSPGTNNADGWVMGAGRNASALFFDGDIQQMSLFSGTISQAEIEGLMDYMMGVGGI